MKRLVFAIALTLPITACGGGGGTSGSAALPANTAQAPAQSAAAPMPAATGTIASGYVECDTAANIAAGNDCNGYANFANGAFAFTAIAANAAGDPIAQQVSGASALGYANGAYRVVESPSDVPQAVAISGGPWPAPGNVLSANGAAYGNRFFVQCVHVGTASLQLQLVSGAQASALPFAASAFAANVTTVNCTASGGVTLI